MPQTLTACVYSPAFLPSILPVQSEQESARVFPGEVPHRDVATGDKMLQEGSSLPRALGIGSEMQTSSVSAAVPRTQQRGVKTVNNLGNARIL